MTNVIYRNPEEGCRNAFFQSQAQKSATKEATWFGFDTDEAQDELSGVTNLRIGPGNGLAAG
ncbi:MAG TPA: hypothetical protein DD979_17825 [Gammaproteobacteria bacterium]|jgi:hypothetical protein|nr:hypothetical protein [Gammaproteobacteria bacterium]